jgi:hypothetical protein
MKLSEIPHIFQGCRRVSERLPEHNFRVAGENEAAGAAVATVLADE